MLKLRNDNVHMRLADENIGGMESGRLDCGLEQTVHHDDLTSNSIGNEQLYSEAFILWLLGSCCEQPIRVVTRK